MNKIIKVQKKIKLRNVIILILLLMFNTYAWFIYATKVSLNLSAHVTSWNVEFVTGTGETITSDIIIKIDRIYPGMENFQKIIEVRNKGETNARISYKIHSLKIMGETFTTTEDGTEITSEQLENKIRTEYPFKINIGKNSNEILAGNGQGRFDISVVWPFESGNDALDTTWGNKAYEYYSLYPNENSIELKIQLIAEQLN